MRFSCAPWISSLLPYFGMLQCKTGMSLSAKVSADQARLLTLHKT